MYGNVPPPGGLSRPSTSSSNGRSDMARRMLNAEKEKEYNALVANEKSAKNAAQRGVERNEEYFEHDSSDEEQEKAPSSRKRAAQVEQKEVEEDEDDELDAFMAEINKQAQKEVKESKTKEEFALQTGEFSGGGEGRDDIDQEDMQESMMKFIEEYKERTEKEDEDIYEYDEDGNIIWTWKKEIDPLPPMDHSKIQYKPFERNFYTEHEEVAKMTPEQTFELRIVLDVRVYGKNPPKPTISFAHMQLDKPIMAQIRRSEFEKPTPIQAQAVPAALSGRDILGLAKTGSGKTLAYIWPAIVHIMNQPELEPGDGPIAVICTPTRELSIQVYNEAKKYTAAYNIACVCAYGGGSKYEQKKALEQGAELGRIIDLVKEEAMNFLRTTFLVFDEVDRMFDLGFEPQVRSISDHIRPDRQCLVFSATCKPSVEKLIMHVLYEPIKIVCGDISDADIQQEVFVMPDLQAKLNWLFANIVKFITMGKVLIFVTKKIEAEDLAKKLKQRDLELVLLHGDMHQQERNDKITAFRTTKSVMVATDVAARGLDIPDVRNVINFDVARDIDTHIHRIGRTGRAGHKGFAYTLITDKDTEFTAHLIKQLKSTDPDRVISDELLAIGLKCPWFKAEHEKQKGRDFTSTSIDGSRMAFRPKERPGLGMAKPAQSAAAQPSSSGFAVPQSVISQPTISKQIERAKSLASTGNVAGMDRISMMRSALKSTFKHSFQPSSSNEFESRIVASDPRPEWKIRLDEQTAKINKAIQEAETGASGANKESQAVAGQSSDEGGEAPPPKRRSRWGT